MLQDRHGAIDYCEQGQGPTIVFVPGSWATRSAWGGVLEALGHRFRTVTTSLPGYGGTRECRTATDCSIDRSSETVEAVIRCAGRPVHLVGHSFGALVCLDLALCGLVPLMSLTLIEPVVFGLLSQAGEHSLFSAFTKTREDYVRSFGAGDREAARIMVDHLGGAGGFAALPTPIREHMIATTPSQILDMSCGFDPKAASLRNILLPTRIIRGERTAPALTRCADLLSRAMANASLHTVGGAGHFMMATHPAELAKHVGEHVTKAESMAWADLSFASPFGMPSRYSP